MVQVATLFCGERSEAREDATVDREQGTATLGVALRSANLLKMSLVTTAAMLAICLLALAETTNTAEATSLPQNGKIAFAGYRPARGTAIFTVEPDGSNLRQLTSTYGDFFRPTWSPDGTKITFPTTDLGKSHISIIGADGSKVRDIYSKEPDGWTEYPTWSPDGTKLAFISNNDIYTVDVDGSNQINLTNTPDLREVFPDFSPNGSQMCFDLFNPNAPKPAAGIYLMDVDGYDPTLLVEEGGECDWSPEGTKIAFSAARDPDVERGKYQKAVEKALAEGDLQKGLEQLKKHSAKFDSTERSYVEVYVINADGSGRTKLTRNLALDTYPRWSPDGKKIAFVSDRDGDPDIYTMDADGSNVAKVTNVSYSESYRDWQPLPRTVPSPDTGGPSLLWVASALLLSGGGLLSALVRRRV